MKWTFMLLAIGLIALVGCAQLPFCPSGNQMSVLPGVAARSPDACSVQEVVASRGLFPGGVARASGRRCPLIDPGFGRGMLGQPTVAQPFTPGPPVGTVTYPYYTVRGPRDFFLNDPRPLGP